MPSTGQLSDFISGIQCNSIHISNNPCLVMKVALAYTLCNLNGKQQFNARGRGNGGEALAFNGGGVTMYWTIIPSKG